jgi:hypothetical protein
MDIEIPEIKLVPTPETEEAKNAIGSKHNNEADTRHKLGGKPDFIQEEEWPFCCNTKMIFYGKLDSIGDNYDLADCGMVYVFVYFDCFNTKSILHTY